MWKVTDHEERVAVEAAYEVSKGRAEMIQLKLEQWFKITKMAKWLVTYRNWQDILQAWADFSVFDVKTFIVIN